MKIKSFECLQSIRNYEKKILGTSNFWSMSQLSWVPKNLSYVKSIETHARTFLTLNILSIGTVPIAICAFFQVTKLGEMTNNQQNIVK